PGEAPPAHGADARRGGRPDPQDPVRRPEEGSGKGGPPDVADDRAADAEGLDRPQGRGWKARRGNVPLPSGPALGSAQESGASPTARIVVEELSSPRAVRRVRPAAAGDRVARPEGEAADEREPARERRPPAGRSPAARFPVVRREGPEARRRGRRGDAHP